MKDKNGNNVLVDDGRPIATIVLPAAPDPLLGYAARDLQGVLERISGGRLPILYEDARVDDHKPQPQPTTRLLLGDSSVSRSVLKEGDVDLPTLGAEEFVLRTVGEDVVFAGGSSRGVAYAVAELFHRLGARWYMPGELGECLPSSPTLTVEPLAVRRAPSFEKRWISNDTEWSLRMRQNLITDRSLPPGFTVLPIRRGPEGSVKLYHTQQVLLPGDVFFPQHPEYYAFVDGKRSDHPQHKLCNSNPEVARALARELANVVREHPDVDMLNLTPTDGYTYCQCENCLALDEPNVPDDQKYSRRQMYLYNRVAEELETLVPGRTIMVGAYHYFTWPPADESMRAHENLAVSVCHYEAYCLAHPVGDPDCPPNRRFLELLESWKKHTDDIYVYEYYFKANWLGLPWPIVHTVAADVPFYKEFGIKGLYTQYSPRYIWNNFLPMYVAAQLLWDHTANVEEILNEFYPRFYGRAAGPMRRWHETLEEQMESSTVHMPGNSPSYGHHIFTRELRDSLKECIREAKELAADPLVKRRVGRMEVQTDYADRFAEIIALRHEAIEDRSGGRTEKLERGLQIFRELRDDIESNPARYWGIMDPNRLTMGICKRMIEDMERRLAEGDAGPESEVQAADEALL